MKSILLVGSIYFDLPESVGEYRIRKMGLLKPCGKFKKLLRALSWRFSLDNLEYFFKIEEVAEEASKSDVVVLFDSSSNWVLTKFATSIEHRVDLRKTQLKFYYWNTVSSLDGLNLSSHWEILSYDKMDCQKYHFRYVGSFYHLIEAEQNGNDYTSDIYFIGTDKGRFAYISSLETNLRSAGISTCFMYVSVIKHFFNKRFCRPIPYSSVLGCVRHSKSILDVTRKGQFGLTLRFFEAMFLNKKLLTTNSYVAEYKLYDPAKILILGADTSIETIQKFIESDFYPYSEAVKQIYSFESWMQRVIDPSVDFNDTICNYAQ